MPPKTTGRANAAKPNPSKKPPAPTTQPARSKTPRTTSPAKSSSPVKANTAPGKTQPSVSPKAIAPLPIAIVKNVHDAFAKLRASTVSATNARENAEADEEDGTEVGSAKNVRRGNSRKGKMSDVGANSPALSKRAKEIDTVFEKGARLQISVFSSELNDGTSVEEWHAWMVAELIGIVKDDLDVAILLDYLWAILVFVHRAILHHTGVSSSKTLDSRLKRAGNDDVTPKQRPAFESIAIRMDAVYQVLFSIESVDKDKGAVARTYSQEWIKMYVELLSVSQGGALLGLGFNTGIAELLWSVAIESADLGSKVRAMLKDEAVCGWALLGKLLVEARATNAFLAVAGIVVACLSKDLPQRREELTQLIRPHAARWGAAVTYVDEVGQTKPRHPANAVISHLNSLKTGKERAPLAYMALLKEIASEDMRDFRTRGFVLASATMDGDSLCGSAKSRAKLQKGEVVIYMDHERLLIKAYDDKGDEEDIVIEYAEMITFDQVHGDGTGFFDITKTGAIESKRQTIRIGVKLEDSALFSAEVKKKMAKFKSAVPRRALTTIPAKSMRSRTRAPKRLTEEHASNTRDVATQLKDDSSLSPVPPVEACPEVLIPHSDSAGQAHSLKPTVTSGTTEQLGSVVAETQQKPTSENASLLEGAQHSVTPATAADDPLRAKSGRVVGVKNSRTGVIKPVSVLKKLTGERAEGNTDPRPHITANKTCRTVAAGAESRPVGPAFDPKRATQDSTMRLAPLARSTAADDEDEGLEHDEQDKDSEAKDRAHTDKLHRLNGVGERSRIEDGDNSSEANGADLDKSKSKIKSKELEAITARAQRAFVPPTIVTAINQGQSANAIGSRPKEVQQKDDKERGPEDSNASVDKNKVVGELSGGEKGAGGVAEGEGAGVEEPNGGGADNGRNGDDDEGNDDKNGDGNESGQDQGRGPSQASKKNKKEAVTSEKDDIHMPAPSQPLANDQGSHSSRVTKTYAKPKVRSPIKDDEDGNSDGDDGPPSNKRPDLASTRQPAGPTRQSPRKAIVTPTTKPTAKRVVLPPAKRLSSGTVRQAADAAGKSQAVKADAEHEDGEEVRAKMPWEGASSKRATNALPKLKTPAEQQVKRVSDEGDGPDNGLNDPFVEGLVAPRVPGKPRPTAGQGPMLRTPAESGGEAKQGIKLMAEKEVQTGPSLQARAVNDHIGADDHLAHRLAQPSVSQDPAKNKNEMALAQGPRTSTALSPADDTKSPTDVQSPSATTESMAPATPPFPTPASHTRPDRCLDEVDKKLVEGLQAVWGAGAAGVNDRPEGACVQSRGRGKKRSEMNSSGPQADPDSESDAGADGDVEGEEEPLRKKKRVTIDKGALMQKSRSEEPASVRPPGVKAGKRRLGTDPLEEVSEPVRKKKKANEPKTLTDPYETAILKITDAINQVSDKVREATGELTIQEIQNQLTRRLRAPAVAARSAQGKLAADAAILVDGFVQESLGIKDNASNAVQAAADKYAELTTFMSDMGSQLGALLKESKDALDAGKKGFSEDLPKVLFAVGKA